MTTHAGKPVTRDLSDAMTRSETNHSSYEGECPNG